MSHIKGVAKSGQNSVLIRGSLKQTVNNIASDTIKITFWTRRSSENKTTESVGTVTAGDMHHSFVITQTENTWQRHVYFTHILPGQDVTIQLKVIEGEFLLDDVEVEHIDHRRDVNKSPISVHVVTLSKEGLGYVTAIWRIVDPESMISKYRWAVGTVKGMPYI